MHKSNAHAEFMDQYKPPAGEAPVGHPGACV